MPSTDYNVDFGGIFSLHIVTPSHAQIVFGFSKSPDDLATTPQATLFGSFDT